LLPPELLADLGAPAATKVDAVLTTADGPEPVLAVR
jgi:hypothetical protein